MRLRFSKSQQVLAFILFISLFLQSCGDSLNSPLTNSAKKDNNKALAQQIDSKSILDQELTTAAGHSITFYKESDHLKAELIEKNGTLTRTLHLPVYIGQDTYLDDMYKQEKIHVILPKNEQPGYLYVGIMGLKGGMQEADEEAELGQEDEINNGSIPNECFCPITQEIMEEPFIAQDGHTYERSAIQRWFDMGKRISPKTGARLLNTTLISNYTMRSLIQDLKDQMPVLAKHKLEMCNIEAAIKLRDEELQEMLEQKGGLIEKEAQARVNLKEALHEKTLLVGAMEQQIKELKKQVAFSRMREQELKAQLMQTGNLVEKERLERLSFLSSSSSSSSLSSESRKRGKEKETNEDEFEAQGEEEYTTYKRYKRYKSINQTANEVNHLNSGTSSSEPLAINIVEAITSESVSDQREIPFSPDNGNTALLQAAYKGKLATVQWLLANGAILTEKNNDGNTALLVAAYKGKLATVQWLLANGATLTEKNNDCNTALLLAAYNGHLDTVQWLLANGATLTDKDNNGNTALLLASYNGHLATVKWLLANGAKLTEKDNYGNTALTLARSNEMKQFLQEAASRNGKGK